MTSQWGNRKQTFDQTINQKHNNVVARAFSTFIRIARQAQNKSKNLVKKKNVPLSDKDIMYTRGDSFIITDPRRFLGDLIIYNIFLSLQIYRFYYCFFFLCLKLFIRKCFFTTDKKKIQQIIHELSRVIARDQCSYYPCTRI